MPNMADWPKCDFCKKKHDPSKPCTFPYSRPVRYAATFLRGYRGRLI